MRTARRKRTERRTLASPPRRLRTKMERAWMASRRRQRMRSGMASSRRQSMRRRRKRSKRSSV
eukprot:9568179-Alexandrium_andersonii.AAC.1